MNVKGLILLWKNFSLDDYASHMHHTYNPPRWNVNKSKSLMFSSPIVLHMGHQGHN